jgi:hypothetical protein
MKNECDLERVCPEGFQAIQTYGYRKGQIISQTIEGSKRKGKSTMGFPENQE